MQEKKLVYLLVFLGMFFILGCATQNNQMLGQEYWRNPVSLEEFAGNWEGHTNLRIIENREPLLDSEVEMRISIDISDSEGINGNVRWDFNRLLNDMLNIDEITEAGLTKDILWKSLAEGFTAEFEEEGVRIGDGFLYFDLSFTVDEFFSDTDSSAAVFEILINESGNRIKLMFPEALSFRLGDAGVSVIILYRK